MTLHDNLALFLWYCQQGLTDEAEQLLEDLIFIDEDQWDNFDLAVRAVTYCSIKNNMSPYLYLILYRLSYSEIILPVKD